MATCPEYRLRLFLSVDLVGSTSYKARKSSPLDDSTSPNPAWVDEIRRFYKEFPELVARHFLDMAKPDKFPENSRIPSVWKTIGDEIVFCCRLDGLDHLAVCIKAFQLALAKYGQYLDTLEKPRLDVKGYGWIAAFPYPNVTVQIFERQPGTERPELPDEATEAAADAEPARFDFLGKEIDAGFRTGRHCSADRLSMSVELAWLVSRFGDARPLDAVKYAYEGRQLMKGVLGDRPYPIVSIYVERSAKRRTVFERESKILSDQNRVLSTPDQVYQFVDLFLEVEELIKPYLRRDGENTDVPNLPSDYRKYRETWERIAEELAKREASEKAAAAQVSSPDDKPQLDEEITQSAAELIQALNSAPSTFSDKSDSSDSSGGA